MADSFFDGGNLPPQFNRASGFDPGPEPKQPDDPELNYDPPEPVPGLGSGGTINVRDVVQEELDGPTRDAIQQAQDRMDRGESEMGDSVLTPEFNRSQEIEGARKEDQERGLGLEPEWDEQAQQEYDRWQVEESQARYDERWGDPENDDPEQQDQAYSDFMRAQNADIESSQDFSPDPGPEHDPDIDH